MACPAAPGPGFVHRPGQQERGHRGGHLKVDPAAVGVQHGLPAGQAAARGPATNIAYTDQPQAARNAQRHERVHGRGEVPGVFQRGPVERPGRPGSHRQRQPDQQPPPAGEPGPGEQRSTIDALVSGTKKISARISLLRRRRTAASSAAGRRSAVRSSVTDADSRSAVVDAGSRSATADAGPWSSVAAAGAVRAGAGSSAVLPGRGHDADEVGRRETGRGGDAGALGGEVDGGGDAIELVLASLDPGRARGAGHAADDELERGRRAWSPTRPLPPDQPHAHGTTTPCRRVAARPG